jgi:hypothetical protein
MLALLEVPELMVFSFNDQLFSAGWYMQLINSPATEHQHQSLS